MLKVGATSANLRQAEDFHQPLKITVIPCARP
jgi:hypothetical protein